MPTKVGCGEREGKFTVDEIITMVNWKLMTLELEFEFGLIYLDEETPVKLDVHHDCQEDDFIIKFLKQFPRDKKFTVIYDQDCGTILI